MYHDAVLIVSFGGPESREDIIPFLENVLRGRNVSRERMLEVAEHYYRFGGRSPLNDQCRSLVAALQTVISIPVYWGNRNWHPMLAETVAKMQSDGIRRALAIATSAYSSYSGCRQYIENIAAARAQVGPGAPEIDKLPPFWNHPFFLRANIGQVGAAHAKIPTAPIVFTAHSIPVSMASACSYEEELRQTASRIAAALNCTDWSFAWQSRSGPPSQPWLEPDILDHLRSLASGGVREVLIAPIGFLSDHTEVLYDLDVEAAALCAESGIHMERAATAGTHPDLIEALRQLIQERQSAQPLPLCESNCCPPPRRPVTL
jgi:ferrochelatase